MKPLAANLVAAFLLCESGMAFYCAALMGTPASFILGGTVGVVLFVEACRVYKHRRLW
jgi:hypothetical protein